MATHSTILAWRIPQIEEPGRLQSMGHKESDMTEHAQASKLATTLQTDSVPGFLGKMQGPHPLFYPNKMAILATFTQS